MYLASLYARSREFGPGYRFDFAVDVVKETRCPAGESSNSKLGCEVNAAHSAATLALELIFPIVENESFLSFRNHIILLK